MQTKPWDTLRVQNKQAEEKKTRLDVFPDNFRLLRRVEPKKSELGLCKNCFSAGYSIQPHCAFCGFGMSKTNWRRLKKTHENA